MPVRVVRLLLIVSAVLAVGSSAFAASTDLFDASKYMRIAEVRPGMTGYGVSVFSGTKLDRFNVEVVSVLKNFNPKDDVVLIRCTGQNLEHTGAIAGMSGSPIYLHDDAGKFRMIGAFAYGWPLTKDPIAGVQPIEYMLALPVRQKDSTTAPVKIIAPSAVPQARMLWRLSDAIPMPGVSRLPRNYPLAAVDRLEPNFELRSQSDSDDRLQPLATPLMTSGLPPKMVEEFGPLFRAYGLTMMQAGGGGASTSSTSNDDTVMHPGSVLAAPLLTGDTDMTAIGTCTEVIGDRVFGFGHPFKRRGFDQPAVRIRGNQCDRRRVASKF